MSRWSRRSQEEKERIAEKLEKESKKEVGFSGLAKLKNTEVAMDIYRNKRIPIACTNCGWSYGENYHAYNDKHPLNPTIPLRKITTTCIGCGKEISRVFPSLDCDDMVLFAMVLTILAQEGRLKDDRTPLERGK